MKIDLKKLIAEIIEQETEMHKTSVLEHNWIESIDLYKDSILEDMIDYFTNEHKLIDHISKDEKKQDSFLALLAKNSDFQKKLFDWINWNQDSCLDYGHGYWKINGEYSIASFAEIEFELSYFPYKLTKVRAEVIERNTDLNISYSDNQILGYIYVGYDHIYLNYGSIDWKDIIEDWEEDNGELGKIYGEPGTLIHATMRNCDLIPVFLNELNRLTEGKVLEQFSYDLDRFIEFTFINGNSYYEILIDDSDQYWETEESYFLLESLFDRLNDYAPINHYFGAHPGDGSDYGFWEIEQLDREMMA